MRKRLALLIWIAPAFLSLFACAPAAPGPPARGLLVIAIDGLRYDHLSYAGYDRPTTPALDELAQEGVFFRQAFAAAPWQIPAHMALISGADPRLARRVLPADVSVNQATQWHLPDEAPHPAASFLSHGISTAMFYDHPNLASIYGYQRGFHVYQGPDKDDDKQRPQFGSEAVFRRFQQWLTHSDPDQSWFAYLEVADLERVWSETDPRWDSRYSPRPELSRVPPVGDAQHLYFAVPRGRWSQGMSTLGEYEARYDGAIAQMDYAFRRLRCSMERLGRFENTTVVIVGSYGMSFGESGMLLDSGTFADVDLHVPLIVRPGAGFAFKAGLRSDDLISTVDVMPTLLEMAGLPITSGTDGQSFLRALNGVAAAPGRVIHASCAYQDGFATLDDRHCFERTWPGRALDPRLSASWFGDNERRPDELREVFHDRREHPSLGHLSVQGSDIEARANLARRGEAWAAKIHARRLRFQGPGVAEFAAPKETDPTR